MPMKFDVPCCSVCGEAATGTLESVPGLALLVFDQQGLAEYAGETRWDWNSQATLRDGLGRAMLECCHGHQWPSHMDDGAGRARNQEQEQTAHDKNRQT